MGSWNEIPVPGVRGLEHTADVGLEVEGTDLPQLFLRGGLGAMWLVLEREAGQVGGGAEEERVASAFGAGPVSFQGDGDGNKAPTLRIPKTDRRNLNLTEEDLPALFRAWLRALLFWEETEGFVFTGGRLAFHPAPLCSAPDGQAFGLQARVEGRVDSGPRVREIKGVTLHELVVERRGDGWYGRVIFDV